MVRCIVVRCIVPRGALQRLLSFHIHSEDLGRLLMQ